MLHNNYCVQIAWCRVQKVICLHQATVFIIPSIQRQIMELLSQRPDNNYKLARIVPENSFLDIGATMKTSIKNREVS